MGPIFLVPVSLGHAPFLQELASDPLIQDTTRLPSPYPPDGARDWISYIIPRHAAGVEYAFTVFAGTEIVGVTGFTDVDLENGTAELGYWIGRPFWGRGLATIAGKQALRYLFDNSDINTAVAPVLERNAASQRVLQKLGFERNHKARKLRPEHGPEDPATEYRLTREAWLRQANG